MATGDSNDIVQRVKQLISGRWFSWTAPIRDAILGGLADSASWCYSWITFTRTQSRIATSTGLFLDLISYDFLGRHLPRNGTVDSVFRSKILATILQERVTRHGMFTALKTLTGTKPQIIEPWNTGDCGGWDIAMSWAGSSPASGPAGGFDIACGWDVAGEWDVPAFIAATVGAGAGCWGDTDLPAQCFIIVTPPGLAGVPNIPGWDSFQGAWDVGTIELVDQSLITGAVTNGDIYDTINTTRPTGTICWTQIT
jgi:hypothetical protein